MDELISRRAMKNMITNHWSDFSNATNYRTALACVDAVPTVTPAQPYTIHSDGRLWVTVDDIDKVNAVVVDENKSKFCKQFYMDAEPERKKGKWIHISEEMWKCDQCGEISCCSPNFCPDCGSDMRQRGEQNG